MFDQNWLKRYMLSNQPVNGGGCSAPAPSGCTAGGYVPPIGLSAARSPPTPVRSCAAPLPSTEESAPVPTGPTESARLRERTGLASSAEASRMPLDVGPGAAAAPSARHESEAVRPTMTTSTAPTRMTPPLAGTYTEPQTLASGFGGQSFPATTSFSSSAKPTEPIALPTNGGQTPAVVPAVMPQSAAGGSFFGVPGPFGYAPFDNSVNMQNSKLFNFGGDGGVKYYVVMCKDDVEVRASPSYADDTRIGHFLHPGQVVVVDDRRMVTGSWFLHLADGRGWVFETKERLLVMTEAHEFERGLWHYAVTCDDDVETRVTPTYSDDARTGIVLPSGDCIAVDERCRVAGARFLKLADGRGWVFETKDRLLVMGEVRAKAQEARDFARGLWHYTVVCDEDVEVRAAPTYSDEARTGLTIHPGDCVAVDERCRIAAVWFLRLADGRGWIFESKDSRRVMMQLH